MRIKTARWNSSLGKKEWRDRGRDTVDVGGTSGGGSGTVMFSGHKPDQVMFGLAAPESGVTPPLIDEALSIIGKTLLVRRTFLSSNISLSGLRTLINRAESNNHFGLLSFKHTNFSDFYEGRMDATLNIIRDEMIARRTSGPGGTAAPPHAIGIYHEPAGDTGIDLNEWAKMQIYCSNYFVGKKPNGPNGTGALVYDAANDVSDQMTWMSIMNGNKWGPRALDTTAINAAHPQLLIDTYKENGSLLGADFYDPIPSSGFITDYKGTEDRTSKKIQAYIDWHRARNCGMLFCGEFGTTEDTEMYNTWKVLRDNRDIFAMACYFDSAANSKWEWRLIPADYPVTSGVALSQYGPGNFHEIGGTAATAAQLAMYRTVIDEANSPTYIGPLGGV